MTFAFPAYHQETRKYSIELPKLVEAAKKALLMAGFPVVVATENFIQAKTSMNMASWGEKIDINLTNDGSINIKSQCSFPTQCFDWGKNKKNVNKFFNMLDVTSKEV